MAGWLCAIQMFNPGQLQHTETVVRQIGYVVDHDPDLIIGNVDEHVLFGSQDVAADGCLLASLNVTHVLNLVPDSNLPQFSDQRYRLQPLLDLPETDLTTELRPILAWISTALLDPQSRVFIHW
jgi:hypothetical protein